MVRFQRLTGCRPSEVCNVRPYDVQRFTIVTERPLPLFAGDRAQPAERELDVWEYRPAHHKTKHKNRQRLIPVGPRAREILRPYLLPLSFTPSAFCFQPPANTPRAKHRPGKGRYTKDTYARAVTRACETAFRMPEHLRERALRLAKKTATSAELARLRKEAAAWRDKHCWSPNQLRHSAATAIRQRYGLDAAQVILGHAEADTTQIYAEADWAKAVQIAREVG
jgi:integrase